MAAPKLETKILEFITNRDPQNKLPVEVKQRLAYSLTDLVTATVDAVLTASNKIVAAAKKP